MGRIIMTTGKKREPLLTAPLIPKHKGDHPQKTLA
jgi:hypothetical protein